MADERESNFRDDQNSSPTTGQHSQENEFGERAQQSRQPTGNHGSEGSFAAQGSDSQSGSADATASSNSRQDDGMAGQPIGGNDSATGTGTTLTQGADFSAQGQPGSAASDTLTAGNDSDFGQGTTSNAGGSTIGSDQTSGGSSGVSGGEGFVGSGGDNSSDYLQQRSGSSGAANAGGPDFAEQGRGALDDEDESRSSGDGNSQ